MFFLLIIISWLTPLQRLTVDLSGIGGAVEMERYCIGSYKAMMTVPAPYLYLVMVLKFKFLGLVLLYFTRSLRKRAVVRTGFCFCFLLGDMTGTGKH